VSLRTAVIAQSTSGWHWGRDLLSATGFEEMSDKSVQIFQVKSQVPLKMPWKFEL